MNGPACNVVSGNNDIIFQNASAMKATRSDSGQVLKSLTSRCITLPYNTTEQAENTLLRPDPKLMAFRNIGLGSCGSVFEVPGTDVAYKKGSKEMSIFRDFALTNRAHEAFMNVSEALNAAFQFNVPKVPKCYKFYTATDDQFWEEHMQRFPASHSDKQPIFSIDHIFPLTVEIREALIELFFSDEVEQMQEAKKDPDNEDCLVRVYLGERESVSQQCEDYGTLRNFPLRLNMIEDLGLDGKLSANEMALGLAVIHWQAQIDAMDIEFVLGSAGTPQNMTPSGAVQTTNFERRQTSMWILDFDKASEFELNKHNVQHKLVPAFLGNDSYYPRPNVDMELWKDFCATYLVASELILWSRGIKHSRKSLLPAYFLAEVSKTLNETDGWSEERNIIFATD